MTLPQLSEADFLSLFEKLGPYKMSRQTGLSLRSIYRRRRRLESKHSIGVVSPAHRALERYPHRLTHEVKDGIVLVGSDAHYWPGIVSTAHRAFVRFCKELKPKLIIKNGDTLDGASISRHPPIGWQSTPSLISEIEAAQERLGEIEAVGKKLGARLVWPCGNHDARFSTRLAMVAPEYAKLNGVSLKDHFPKWEPCWSIWLNNEVVIKHRYKGGIHATHNNTVSAGKTIITGHLHSLKVTPFTDYNGTRWGVDTGTLADPEGPQFVDYTEDSPKSWRSGFVVLTFKHGQMLWPELVWVRDEVKGEVEFRGEIITV